MLPSLDYSPLILVLCVSRSSRNSDGVTPRGTAKQRWGMKMSQFSTNNLLYLRNGWRVYAARRLTSIESSSQLCEFTEIVPGAYSGEAKMCKKCAKMANFWTFGFNYWETVEDRWIHAARRLTSIEFSFDPCEFTAIVPGAYPGEAKMCLRLSWRSQMLAPATTYRRDSREVAKWCALGLTSFLFKVDGVWAFSLSKLTRH